VQHGDTEDGAKVSELLSLCEGVVRIGKDVGDVNDLALPGLAVAQPERMVAGGRRIEVARVRITEAGRRALTER